MDSKDIEISGLVMRQTKEAIRFSDGTVTEWIAKSLIIEPEELKDAQAEISNKLIELTIPEWVAIQKGFV